MPRIYVDFQKFKEIGNRCSSVADKLNKIRTDFNTTIKKLDWDLKIQYDINKRAGVISAQLEEYRKILKLYQRFINEAYAQYAKLENDNSLKLEGDSALKKWSKDFFSLKSTTNTFSETGSVGNFFSWINSVKESVLGFSDGNILKGSISTAESGFYLTKIIDEILPHIEKFQSAKAAGTATVTSKDAWADWAKEFLGYQEHSGISTASGLKNNFLENINSPNSPFSFESILKDYQWNGGIDPSKAIIADPANATAQEIKEAAKVAEQLDKSHKNFAFSVGEVVFSGTTHLMDNIDEMKKSDGDMSATRVGAETVIETAVDLGINKAAYAFIGAGVTSALVVAGAPVAAGFIVGTIASGLVVTLLDTGVEALTGKPIAEWASDLLIDGSKTIVKAIGDNVKSTAESFAQWADKLIHPSSAT